MPRIARLRFEQGGGWYHITARAAGHKNEFPLQNPLCQSKLSELFVRFSQGFCIDIAGFCIMGNHYHMVVRFEDPRPVTDEELVARARALYSRRVLDDWLPRDWTRFKKRIFDVSELMRSLQGRFASWYNRTFERRGQFWGDRFHSTLLENEKQVLECLMYVDLNPVRARLVKKPEDHEAGSFHLRETGKGRWLMDLREVLGTDTRAEALRIYRGLVYHRGAVRTKDGQAIHLEDVLEQQEVSGFSTRGVYRKRQRHFVAGLALGSEAFIEEQLGRMRASGTYMRRRKPIAQLDGQHFTVREQRSHAL